MPKGSRVDSPSLPALKSRAGGDGGAGLRTARMGRPEAEGRAGKGGVTLARSDKAATARAFRLARIRHRMPPSDNEHRWGGTRAKQPA